MNDDLEILRERLAQRRGTLTRIAGDSGISYSWLMQFVHGKITNPTVGRVHQLRAALQKGESPEDRAA